MGQICLRHAIVEAKDCGYNVINACNECKDWFHFDRCSLTRLSETVGKKFIKWNCFLCFNPLKQMHAQLAKKYCKNLVNKE